jgi:hypothetical protein
LAPQKKSVEPDLSVITCIDKTVKAAVEQLDSCDQTAILARIYHLLSVDTSTLLFIHLLEKSTAISS